LAKALIDSLSAKWNPEKYRDDYREALMEVIEEKVEAGGKEIEEKPKPKKAPTKVIDLVSVLQQSLEKTGSAKKKTKARAKHAPEESGVICSHRPVGGQSKRATGRFRRITEPWLQHLIGLTDKIDILQPR